MENDMVILDEHLQRITMEDTTFSQDQVQGKQGATLLYLAVQSRGVQAVRQLLNFNVPVNAMTSEGISPIYLALNMANNTETLGLLIATNFDVLASAHFFGLSTIEIAIKSQKQYQIPNDIIVSLMRKLNPQAISDSARIKTTEFQSNCPLIKFLPLKDAAITSALIRKGFSINFSPSYDGYTAIHEATRTLDINNLNVLVNHGADVNALTNGKTTLSFIENFDDVQLTNTVIIRLLLAGAKLYDREKQILYTSNLLLNGFPSTIRLINRGLDLNFIDSSGMSPLVYLAQNTADGVFDELVDSQFNVNVSCRTRRKSLLHYAALAGNVSSVEYLLDRGADVNKKDASGFTALRVILDKLLIRGGHRMTAHTVDQIVDCGILLLESNANPDVYEDKQTARNLIMHAPFSNNRLRILSCLINHLSLSEQLGHWISDGMAMLIIECEQLNEMYCEARQLFEDASEMVVVEDITVRDVILANGLTISDYVRNLDGFVENVQNIDIDLNEFLNGVLENQLARVMQEAKYNSGCQ